MTQYALIRTASTAATLVSGATGLRTTVLGMSVVTPGASASISIQSSGKDTATLAHYKMGALGPGLSLRNSRDGHFQTAAGAALVVLESTTATLTGHIVYKQGAVT